MLQFCDVPIRHSYGKWPNTGCKNLFLLMIKLLKFYENILIDLLFIWNFFYTLFELETAIFRWATKKLLTWKTQNTWYNQNDRLKAPTYVGTTWKHLLSKTMRRFHKGALFYLKNNEDLRLEVLKPISIQLKKIK